MNRFWKSGDPFVWLTGGALALSLIMVAGLVYLVLAYGLGFFWPSEILRLTLKDGTVLLGELADREKIPQPGAAPGTLDRYGSLKIGCRDLYGADFGG
jgi:phosphate transport system permease protein